MTNAQDMAAMAALERRLAERAVIADLETTCDSIVIDGTPWWDTRPMIDPREHAQEVCDMAREALQYAECRELITWHPQHPHLARVLRQPS